MIAATAEPGGGALTGLLNYAELSRSSGLPQTTLKRYLALFATYLIQTLPAWSGNLSKRLVSFTQAAAVGHGTARLPAGLGEAELPPTDPHVGPLMENLVGAELRKLASWSRAARAVPLPHARSAGVWTWYW